MKILVSACLLGLHCRFDGAAKSDPAIIALSGEHVLIPYCPEVYGGLPTPRDPSEIRDGRVFAKTAWEVTVVFEKGAAEAVLLAKTLGCTARCSRTEARPAAWARYTTAHSPARSQAATG